MNDRRQQSLIWGMLIFFTLLILIIALARQARPYLDRVKIEMGEIDWSQFFNEPYEKLIIIFTDQTWIGFHTYDEGIINLSPAYIIRAIKDNCGMGIKDIATIIHNHPTPRRFTAGDNFVYNYFLNGGFRGAFMIYYSFSDKTIKKEAEN